MHAGVLFAICVLLATATATGFSPAPSTDTSELPTGTSAPPPSSTTPPGYLHRPATGSWYKYHAERASWDNANATCSREGAYLVVLNNAEEARIVKKIVWDNIGDYYGAWIGLRDSRPGGVMDWRTVNGEPISEVFNVWRSGRPTNDEYTPCAAFDAYSRHMVDEPCDIRRYFLCEISQ